MKLTRLSALVVFLSFCLLTACSGLPGLAAPSPTVTSTLDPTVTPLPTSTRTPTTVPSPTPTQPPTASPTPPWLVQGPGRIACPILLYHHVAQPGDSVSNTSKIYYVPPDEFETQLKALHDWGYMTISTFQLQKAILDGAPLPAHPVVITFDDGNLDVYQNAFPIMQKYGFTGTVYIIVNQLHANGYMNPDQIKTLAASGWEIGSHSLSHHDLRLDPARLEAESAQSRLILEQTLGVSVRTFAYPYGLADEAVTRRVQDDGYLDAVGLGGGWSQGVFNLYYLSRRPVLKGTDLLILASYLPFSGLATPAATP
jgi:peptidoglycan/xylan/chitin deacetylase (PgdA/CDA1 family)